MFLGTSGAFLNNSMQSSREKAANSPPPSFSLSLSLPPTSPPPPRSHRKYRGSGGATGGEKEGRNEWNFRGIRSSSRQTWLENASDSESDFYNLIFAYLRGATSDELPALREKSKFSGTFARASPSSDATCRRRTQLGILLICLVTN